jgi:hypothetical protein
LREIRKVYKIKKKRGHVKNKYLIKKQIYKIIIADFKIEIVKFNSLARQEIIHIFDYGADVRFKIKVEVIKGVEKLDTPVIVDSYL